MIFKILLSALVILNNEIFINCVNSFKFPEKNNLYNQNDETLKIFNFTDRHSNFQCITEEGIKAHCKLVSKCLSAKEKDLSKHKPSICFWDNLEPVVCCEDKVNNEEINLNLTIITSTSNNSYIYVERNNLSKKSDSLPKYNNQQIDHKNKSSEIEVNKKKMKDNQKKESTVPIIKPNCGRRINLNNLPSNRIVKGNQTRTSEFPWTVAIYVAQEFSSKSLLSQNLNISDQIKKKNSNNNKMKNLQPISRKNSLKKKIMNSIFEIQKATSINKYLIRKKRFFFLPKRINHYRTVSTRQEPFSSNPFLIPNSIKNSNFFSSNKFEGQRVGKNLKKNFFFSPTNVINKSKFIPINSNSINNLVLKDKKNSSSINLTVEKTTSKPSDDLKIETENQFDFKNTGISLKQECGGSIVNEYFILTAAHCVESRDPNNYNIGVGSNKIEELKIYPIKKIIIHPDYDSKQFYHDIALLELKSPLKFDDYIQPICLPNRHLLNFFNLNDSYLGKNDNENDKSLDFNLTKGIPKSSFYITGDQDLSLPNTNSAVVVGWGSTSYNGLNSNILNKALVNLVKHDECDEIFKKLKSTSIPNGITKDLLCASGSIQKDLNDLFLDNQENSTPDACQNDSGGPMYTKLSYFNLDKDKQNFSYFNFNEDNDWQENWYQLGIVSFGYRCGMKDYPGVYTNVANYYDWISNIINRKNQI